MPGIVQKVGLVLSQKGSQHSLQPSWSLLETNDCQEKGAHVLVFFGHELLNHSIALLDGKPRTSVQAFARKKPQIVKETAVLKPANGATYTPTVPAAVLPSSPNPRAKAVVSAEEVPQVPFSACIEQDGGGTDKKSLTFCLKRYRCMYMCSSPPSKMYDQHDIEGGS